MAMNPEVNQVEANQMKSQSSNFVSRTTVRRVALGLAVALCLAGAAHAQRSSGNIVGKALSGDTIVVQGLSNGFHRELSSKEDGKYRVSSVPAGEYTVSIQHADGTRDTYKRVVVRVGSTARVP